MFQENLELLNEYYINNFIQNHSVENVVKNIFNGYENNVRIGLRENYSILSNSNIEKGAKEISSIFINDIIKKKIKKEYWSLTFGKLIRMNFQLYFKDILKIYDKNGKVFDLPCYFIISTKGENSKNGELFSGGSFSYINNVKSFDENSPVELYLNVNLDSKISDIISDTGIKELDDIMVHEIKHAFDYVNNVKYGRGDYLYNRYIGNGEYQAYTGTLLKELENNYNAENSFKDSKKQQTCGSFSIQKDCLKNIQMLKNICIQKLFNFGMIL